MEMCHDPCPSSSFCNTEDMVLCFLKRVSNNLLNVDGEECLLLLEICGIVIYILTELQAKREIIIKRINIITFILSRRNQLLLSMRLAFKNKKKEAVTNFKFGVHEVNSAVGKCDFETVLELLKIVCGICYIQIKEYAKCVACLEVCEDGAEKLQVISSYLKGMYVKMYRVITRNSMVQDCSFTDEVIYMTEKIQERSMKNEKCHSYHKI